MYRVLKPRYEKTGETTTNPDGSVTNWQRVASWQFIGTAASMADALEKYPRSYWTHFSPILEEVR